MKLSVEAALRSTYLPLVHLSMDMWLCKISACKYLGVRITYNDQDFVRRSHLLACTLYNPRHGSSAADEQIKWVKMILARFGVELSDIFCATTDAGSDVKAAAQHYLARWEWCIPHMLARALKEAFGLPSANGVIARLKEALHHVQRSQTLKARFQQAQLEEFGSVVQLARDAPQRWSSMINVIYTALCEWKALRDAFLARGIPFTCDLDHRVLIELHSLLLPFAELTKSSQNTTDPAVPVVLVQLVNLLPTLNAAAPLFVVDPASEQLGGLVAASDLCQTTTEVRAALLVAVDKRFLGPYRSTSGRGQHRMYELAMLMFPSTKGLHHIERLFPGQHSFCNEVRVSARKEIRALALEVLRKKNDLSSQPPAAMSLFGTRTPAVPAVPAAPAAPAGLAALAAVAAVAAPAAPATGPSAPQDPWAALVEANQDLFGRAPSETLNAHANVEAQVDAELVRYEMFQVDPTKVTPATVMAWWRDHKDMFPTLSVVARSVLGFPVSAAAIERDFSIGGHILTAPRARMLPERLEMLLFLKANISLVQQLDLGDLGAGLMTEAEVNAVWSQRFDKPTDIAAAVAAIAGEDN